VKEQGSIPKGKIGRAASLAGTGVRIGANYARYHAHKLVTGKDDREALHRANATDTYNTLSRLKGGPLKVAQMLSIDTAFLPPAYAEQFAQAHYQAPPLSYPLVERTFQRDVGRGRGKSLMSSARTRSPGPPSARSTRPASATTTTRSRCSIRASPTASATTFAWSGRSPCGSST